MMETHWKYIHVFSPPQLYVWHASLHQLSHFLSHFIILLPFTYFPPSVSPSLPPSLLHLMIMSQAVLLAAGTQINILYLTIRQFCLNLCRHQLTCCHDKGAEPIHMARLGYATFFYTDATDAPVCLQRAQGTCKHVRTANFLWRT